MTALLRQMAADSPLLLAPFTETGGSTAFDLSGNGRHGTYGGAPTLNASVPPLRGYRATTTSQYVSWGTIGWLAGLTAVSWECWSLIEDVAGTPHSTFDWNGASLTNRLSSNMAWSDDTWYADFGNTTGGRISLAAQAGRYGTLHQFVGCADGSAKELWVDGVMVASAGTGMGSLTGTGPLTFGIAYDTITNGVKGYHSHFGLYGSRLSAARIKAHYEAGIRSGVVVG